MKLFWGVIFFLPAYSAAAQDSILNKYGLHVIKSVESYRESVLNKPGFEMTGLKNKIPGIKFDMRYAAGNNFLHKKLYPSPATAFIRMDAATALSEVQNELKQKGLCLKIFDAYRPYSVTEKIWRLVKDERYAASPEKGSNHNRGVAVDLTIIEIKTNTALNMGTDFDCFNDSAHHDFTALPDTVLKNRLLLRTIMKKHGFIAMETEWWHYSLPDAKEYELLDLSFKQLDKYQSKNRLH